MFVNIIHFPPIVEGKDADFREWFAWSNEQYAPFPGFISRKLLKPRKQGGYAEVIEHESYDTFMAMHASDVQREASERVKPLFDGSPSREFFEVVVG
jgi:heme-degrading monooxygenase HmoA